MSYHIQNDNMSQKFEAYEGKDLPWTLYDGTLAHGFYATREDALADFDDIVDDAAEEVARLQQELDETEDLLQELRDTSL